MRLAIVLLAAVLATITHAAAPAAAPLEALRAASSAAHSSALVVVEDGQTIVEDYDDKGPRRISVQSIAKSIASLALGPLMAEGKIESLDDPVARYLPEFSGDGRERITLRHVLSHTSGLALESPFGLDVEGAYSFAASAIAARPSGVPPGALRRYDNRAWQLVCAVVHAASGEDVQDYLRARLFTPLGIDDVEWARDPSGATMCHAGLAMRATDLAKIGQLLLDRGVQDGRTIIPRSWLDLALPMRADVPMGSVNGLWWESLLLDEDVSRVHVDTTALQAWVEYGLDEATAARIRDLDGASMTAFYDAMMARPMEAQVQLRDARTRAAEAGAGVTAVRFRGPLIGLLATGGGGQYLRVDLRDRRVVVRLIDAERVDGENTAMRGFGALTAALLEDADAHEGP